MNPQDWLDKVVLAATKYNDRRLHTNFQQEEVLKFLEYLHGVYDIPYNKPEAKHRNMPHKIGT